MTLMKTTQACILHKRHEPVSHINEKHHIFPEWLQALATVDIPAPTKGATVVVCATGHNNIHAALNYFITNREWPRWLVGEQARFALFAMNYCNQYGVDLNVARQHLHGGAE
jgi:hypothetical protein